MLESAKLYEDQLNSCMAKTVMDQYYKWYHLQYPEPAVVIDNTFWNKIQLVSTYDGIVQGYFKATFQRPESYIDNITCVNFNKENKNIFAVDIRRFLKYLVYDLNVSKMMWSVVIGNPIEKHYDRIIKRFSGRIIGIERYAFLINGKYYDKKMYEWIRIIGIERYAFLINGKYYDKKMYEWINDYYECTHCDNKEKKEREVMCWKCGLGEMVYRNPFMKGKY
jgi:hypothetical protein